jgi:hypothetical protein
LIKKQQSTLKLTDASVQANHLPKRTDGFAAPAGLEGKKDFLQPLNEGN